MDMISPVWLKTNERLLISALSMDLSTTDLPKATIVIPASENIPGIHDFIQITNPQGLIQNFRVVSYNYNYGQTVTLQLIGAADTFSDDVYNVIAEEEETKTAAAWLALILAKQTVTRWQLGTCALSANVKIKTNYQDLWSLMEVIRKTRSGYWWTFDYSTSPWTINLVALSDNIVSEFRLSRNIESAQISISDQDLCNRLVFTVNNSNGTSSATTYDDLNSQSKYGVRTRCTDIKEDEIPSGMTAAEYAAQELARNADPIVTIVISGADLSQLTGEPLDKFTLGAKCRAVLPDLGDPVIERVVGFSWPNIVDTPDKVKITLSTEPASFTGSIASAKKIAQAVKASGGGGGGSSAADKDGWAKVLTDVIDAVDGTGIEQLWQSGIQITSHGGVRIFSLYQGLSSLDSELTVNNTAITAEVTRATTAEGVLSGRINVTADAITAEVTRATTAEGTLSGNITINAGKIALVVSETQGGNVINAASIVAAINSAGSSVIIDADHIDLNGVVTALVTMIDSITPAEGTLTIYGDLAVGGDLGCGTFSCEDSSIDLGGNTLDLGARSASWQSQTVVTGVTITLPSFTTTGTHIFAVTNVEETGIIGHYAGKLVTTTSEGSVSVSTTTINYLGGANGNPNN